LFPKGRVLLDQHTRPPDGKPGWDLHQLRHSAATHLGGAGVPLQLIMAKTRHRNPRTAMRYTRPGPEAVAEITATLDLTPRRT
jgi:integrase